MNEVWVFTSIASVDRVRGVSRGRSVWRALKDEKETKYGFKKNHLYMTNGNGDLVLAKGDTRLAPKMYEDVDFIKFEKVM